MPENQEGAEVVAQEGVPVNGENVQTLSLLLQRAFGDGSPALTEEQTTTVIAQKGKRDEYINDALKRDSYDKKFILVVVLVFMFGFSALVLRYYPDVFSEVIALMVGLFGGGIGGYGIGSKGSN